MGLRAILSATAPLVVTGAVFALIGLACWIIAPTDTWAIGVFGAAVFCVAVFVIRRLGGLNAHHVDTLYYSLSILAVIVAFAVELPRREEFRKEQERLRDRLELDQLPSGIELVDARIAAATADESERKALRDFVSIAIREDLDGLLQSFHAAAARSTTSSRDTLTSLWIEACGPRLKGGRDDFGLRPDYDATGMPSLRDAFAEAQCLSLSQQITNLDQAQVAQDVDSLEALKSWLLSSPGTDFAIGYQGRSIPTRTLADIVFDRKPDDPTIETLKEQKEELVGRRDELELKLGAKDAEVQDPTESSSAVGGRAKAEGAATDTVLSVSAYPALSRFTLFFLPLLLIGAVGLKLSRAQKLPAGGKAA